MDRVVILANELDQLFRQRHKPSEVEDALKRFAVLTQRITARECADICAEKSTKAHAVMMAQRPGSVRAKMYATASEEAGYCWNAILARYSEAK